MTTPIWTDTDQASAALEGWGLEHSAMWPGRYFLTNYPMKNAMEIIHERVLAGSPLHIKAAQLLRPDLVKRMFGELGALAFEQEHGIA